MAAADILGAQGGTMLARRRISQPARRRWRPITRGLEVSNTWINHGGRETATINVTKPQTRQTIHHRSRNTQNPQHLQPNNQNHEQ
jgi:hypothetical protein